MSGGIPPELGNLVNLEILALSGNHLSDCESFTLPHGTVECSQHSVTIAPTDRRIAFNSNTEVWVMNADGSGQTQLTTGYSLSPSEVKHGAAIDHRRPTIWSPDGRRIAFRSEDRFGLSVMNADGSGQTRLTDRGAGTQAGLRTAGASRFNRTATATWRYTS